MKIAHYFPVKHDASFGERIKALRESKGIKNERILAEQIFYTSDKYEKSDDEDVNNGTIESIRKRINNHIKQNDCNPKMEFIKEYCDFFKCDSDFLLGYIDFPTKSNQGIFESLGLSNESITILEHFTKLREKNKSEYHELLPSLGTDIDAINFILEYEYQKYESVKEQHGFPSWSLFHYIKQYLLSENYERQLQDKISVLNGRKWYDIETGDALIKNNTEEQIRIECLRAVNSTSNGADNPQDIYLENKNNKKDCYIIDTDKIFESYAKDNIFRELDKIKTFVKNQEGDNNEVT